MCLFLYFVSSSQAEERGDGGFGLHLAPSQGQPTMLFGHIFVTYVALFEIHKVFMNKINIHDYSLTAA